MLKYFFQAISEIILICLYPFSAILLKILPQNHFMPGGEGEPLIIVERWVNYNIRHLYWKYYLQKKGFKVYIVNFPLYKGDFEKSGVLLDKFIKSYDLTDVILVGISSGALTSLSYLEDLNGWKRVKKFIAVGAPFEGTWSAIFLLFSYSGWEMLPNGYFAKKMKKISIHNKEKILCIKAKFDEMVPSGSDIEGAHSVTINIIGHNNLHLMIRTTYREIIKFASK